jgi:hypothetical protein
MKSITAAIPKSGRLAILLLTVVYVRHRALPSPYFDLALQYELKKAGKSKP